MGPSEVVCEEGTPDALSTPLFAPPAYLARDPVGPATAGPGDPRTSPDQGAAGRMAVRLPKPWGRRATK